jgi:hypothetical protein
MTKELQITQNISKEIQLQLMNGKPLTTICQDKALPSLSRLYKEIQNNKVFAQEIMDARRVGCQGYLDKMITELDTADSKNIMVLREKLHHYRWLASKLIAVYGDRKEVAVDQRIEISWNAAEDKSYENDARNVTNSGSTQEANTIERTS